MERQDYPAMLPQLQPAQAVDILNDRVRQVGSLNTAIANWLQERRKLEEQYSAGLRKLARKQIEDVDLGIFSVAWSTLTESADTLADSHTALATKIETDVEQPLRGFATSNREMQSMTTMQGNLASMAKDVEKAQQKTEKLKVKGDRAEAGRIADADRALDHAQLQWESQAPYVFENLQAVDETRVNHLRDALTQFQTHEVDMVQKNQASAEHCLNVVLSLQTEDEIKTFALKSVSGKPRTERTQRPSIPTPPRAAPSSSMLTPTISQPDSTSQRSGSVHEEKKKSRLGGLKRLGTVMGGRKRDSRIPAQFAPMAEAPERKPKASPFNSFSSRLGRSKDIPTLSPPQEATSPRQNQRPRSPLRLGSEMMEPSSESRPEPPSPTLAQRVEEARRVNGTSVAARAAAVNIPNGSHQGDLADLDPPKPSRAEPEAQQPPIAEPVQDNEGYSLPPLNLDPISQAQQDAAESGERLEPAYNVNIRAAPIHEEGGDSEAALASVATKLQVPPPIQSRVGTVRGRRQPRPMSVFPNTYTPPAEQPFPEPVAESAPSFPAPSEDAARDTLEPSPTAPTAQPSNMEPTALAQSPSGAFGSGVGAAPSFSPFSSTMSQPPALRPDSRAALGTDHTGDTQSVRSGRSLVSTGSQGTRHPELTESGLNSSIVETVNARFENGKVVSSSVTGEVALAYNPTDFPSSSNTETIRLEQFSSLEKVAPNPAFITSVLEREGEYTVSLAHLAKTQVAFKYQLKPDPTATGSSQAPLLITLASRLEATQASIILSYTLHPAFNPHGRDAIALSNLTLALTLEGARATGCQSKPVGTFARDRNLLYWHLGDVTLKPGDTPGKLLARFATDSEASAGNVEAKWEIAGGDAQMLGSGLAVSVQSSTTHPHPHQPGGNGADPFADDDNGAAAAGSGLVGVWKGVRGAKRLVGGVYMAK